MSANVTHCLVAGTALPPLALVERFFADDSLDDVGAAASRALSQSVVSKRIPAGASIAVAVGSRGISDLPELVGASVDWLRSLGARPFVVPAMGSHGRATAEGQTALLADLGVDEQRIGCPIRSSMEVVQLGTLPNGLPVYIDALAYAADGIFVINRVKPHSSFNGPHESGLIKMITIGLGKQIGADSCHTYGFAHMHENLPAMAEVSLREAKILGGLAVVENAHEKACVVEAVAAEHLLERDAALLLLAKEKLPILPFTQLDVLVVDAIGKNIAGTGMDSNVIGRFSASHMQSPIKFTKIAVLDLTPESHGNASGMGFADFITRRLRDKADFQAMYANCLTATETRPMCMPPVMDSDEDAIKAAVKTCFVPRTESVRMVHIKNTLEMQRFAISAALMEEALAAGCRLVRDPLPLRFSAQGELDLVYCWGSC